MLALFSKPLSSIHFDITVSCNLKCKYCFLFEDSSIPLREEFLTKEDIIRILQNAKKYNIKIVTFSGGEPFLREDFLEILKSEEAKDFWKVIITNGTLLNERIIEELSKIPRIIELKVSLDVLERRDEVRGIDSKTVKRRLDVIYRRTYIPVFINTTVTQYNYDKLESLYEFVKNHPAVAGWALDILIPRGRALKNKDNLFLKWEDVRPYLVKIAKRYFEEKPNINLILGPIPLKIFLFPELLRDDLYIFSIQDHPCNYLRGLTLRSDGIVSLCPSLPLSLYKVEKKDLENFDIGEILKKIEKNSSIQQFLNLKIEDKKNCVGCKYLPICGGGCPAHTLGLENSLTTRDVISCELMDFVFDELIQYMPELSRKYLMQLIT